MAKSLQKKTWPGGVPRRNDLNLDRQLEGKCRPPRLNAALPLVHTTTTWNANEALKIGSLVVNYCDVFRKELLYFFVHRPAYRARRGTEESHQLSRFPAVFIMKEDAVPHPYHVYPFDSGGAAKGAFQSQADPNVPLEDYELGKSKEKILDFISWAFGSIENYFEGRLSSAALSESKPFESVVIGYLDIARLGIEGSNVHDKRASCIEVSTDHNVSILGNCILMIFPRQYVDGNSRFEDLIAEIIKRGGDVRYYDWQPNRAPDEFQAEILRISREWYRLNGFLK